MTELLIIITVVAAVVALVLGVMFIGNIFARWSELSDLQRRMKQIDAKIESLADTAGYYISDYLPKVTPNGEKKLGDN